MNKNLDSDGERQGSKTVTTQRVVKIKVTAQITAEIRQIKAKNVSLQV